MKGQAAIRPVGEPIPRPADVSLLADEPIKIPGYRCEYLRSGTQALTLAVRSATSRSGADERRRVLLPAYTCPDLVSAIELAGGVAVLVDLERDRPFMDRAGVAAELANILEPVRRYFANNKEAKDCLETVRQAKVTR